MCVRTCQTIGEAGKQPFFHILFEFFLVENAAQNNPDLQQQHFEIMTPEVRVVDTNEAVKRLDNH